LIATEKYLRILIIIGLIAYIPKIGQGQENSEQLDENSAVIEDSILSENGGSLSGQQDGDETEIFEEDVVQQDAEEQNEYAEDVIEDEFEVLKPVEANMDQLITLDLRGMDVNDALTYIALRSGANIVASKLVSGRVTLQLKNVPLKDVFDITLLTNNLAYEKIGNIFYVMSDKEYEARYGQKFSDIRQVKIFQLKYAIPEKAFDLLDTLKSSIGRILVDQQSGAVLMVDTEEKIIEMESALATLEQKNEVTIFKLQYAQAADVEEQLRTQLDDINVGSIWSDERNNQVIVRALADRMADVENIIAALDEKTLEVLIDTKIIKIKVSDTMSTGIEWEGMFQQLFDSAGGGFIGSHVLQPIERANLSFIDDFSTILLFSQCNPIINPETIYTPASRIQVRMYLK